MPGSGPVLPTEPYFDKGLWGYDGSQWRKLGLLWGYRDRVRATVYEADGVAGANTISTDPVPAGVVHVYESICALNVITNPSILGIYLYSGAAPQWIAYGGGRGVNVPVIVMGRFTLKEGDYVSAYFTGCAAGDDLVLRCWGFSMAVG